MKPSYYHILYLLAICLFSGPILKGQQSALEGRVYDATDLTSIPGAIVEIMELQSRTITHLDGSFVWPDIPAGQYTLRVRMTGYAISDMVIEHRTDTIVRHKLSIAPSPFSLEAVEVTAQPEAGSASISAVDIHLRPIQTSQDILRMVPGLLIAQHAGGGKAEQIFLRGFDIDHGTDISITTDGIPVNMVSHAHGQGYADLHYVIPETMDQVHFGKGPYHTHRGNMATAGYVGFQTRTSLDESKLLFQVGQYGTLRGVGLFNLLDQSDGDVTRHAYLAGEYALTDGYFESPQDFRRLNLFGKYNGSLGKNHFLTVSGSVFRSQWNASGQIPERAVSSGQIGFFGAIDDTEGGSTSRANANLQLHTVLSNRSRLKNQLYYSRYGFELFSNFTFFLEDPVNGDQIRQRENRDLFGWNSNYFREDKWLNLPVRTEVGLQLRQDFSNDNELSHTANRSEIIDRLAYGDIRESNVGAYINETISLTKRLTLNAGVRFDHFTFAYQDRIANTPFEQVADDIWSPKLNVYYLINPKLQLYGNAGYGFHSNDTRVVVARQANETLPRALGMDAGFVWKPTETILINAGLWNLDLDQEFVYVGDAAVVEPSGRSRRQGVELSVRVQLLDWLYADTDFNYTKAIARDEPSGANYIPLAPVFSSIGGLTVNTGHRWSGSLRYRHLGNRPANEDNSLEALGYTLFDAMVRYKVKSFELGINADNLFNTRWREAQFETESRLSDEDVPVTEIHFTPGTPFLLRFSLGYTF